MHVAEGPTPSFKKSSRPSLPMLVQVAGVVFLSLALAMLAACGSAPNARGERPGITSAEVSALW